MADLLKGEQVANDCELERPVVVLEQATEFKTSVRVFNQFSVKVFSCFKLFWRQKISLRRFELKLLEWVERERDIVDLEKSPTAEKFYRRKAITVIEKQQKKFTEPSQTTGRKKML